MTVFFASSGGALAHEAMSGIYSGHGVVTAVQPTTGALTIEHDKIEGFMPAMEMMYKVKNPELSKYLHPGDSVDFKIDSSRYEILEVTLRGRDK